jgi:hypothetical protein
MTGMRTLAFLAKAAVISLAAGAVTACGSGAGGATTAPHPKAPSGAPATVSVANTSLGKLLVDSQGRSLYLFVNDHKPGDVNGQGVNGFGALWYALSATGHQISTPPPSGGGRSGGGSGSY